MVDKVFNGWDEWSITVQCSPGEHEEVRRYVDVQKLYGEVGLRGKMKGKVGNG